MKEKLQALENLHQSMMAHKDDLKQCMDYFEQADTLGVTLSEAVIPQPLKLWEAQQKNDGQWELLPMEAEKGI